MDSLWQAENGLVWNQVINGAPPNKEIGVHVFYRCQCTTVETVRELTEFSKSIPGFVDLFLNDQVMQSGGGGIGCIGMCVCVWGGGGGGGGGIVVMLLKKCKIFNYVKKKRNCSKKLN